MADADVGRIPRGGKSFLHCERGESRLAATTPGRRLKALYLLQLERALWP
jgi:hypothetical protein